ncbi:MAG: hypothetical protein U0354_12980 [Candidatus Sericytochromatia bacterium]
MIDYKEHQKYIRAIQGFGFSLGSPLGLIFVRFLEGIPPSVEIATNYDIYLYMTLGTMITFITFGYVIGKNEGNLEKLSIIDPLTSLYLQLISLQ